MIRCTKALLVPAVVLPMIALPCWPAAAGADDTFRVTSPPNPPDNPNVVTRTLVPLKSVGGTCRPNKSYSHSMVSRGKHRYGPDTFGARNTTKKAGSQTFTSETTESMAVSLSASLEIDLGAWIAGVKAALGVELSRSWAVSSGHSLTVGVPAKKAVYANYGWDSVKVRTTLTRKFADCTSHITSVDVSAPQARTWEWWSQSL